MQRLMEEERELFLEEHPKDRGNGYYERAILTPRGLTYDLRVARKRTKGFYPAILPERRKASLI